jgi:two-component system invasion response regulator UvrY
MCLTTSGKSLKEIAGELSISIQTVGTHRARILKKMGLHTSAELIRYALENELVD